ncbi:MAG: hypothetical protein CPDRYMAC_1609 [uncultured Paraburkholderia sp.]|nr:MAG: hypothetical protein CPDRYDRY_1581 [uncultured Paraburkholderia sp.]CAH2919627.1 MAG: hypothetical protein CPDRYMAC_1609 [uncultured Paraburkholderia sp.]
MQYTTWKTKMSYQDLDRDIAHLELVLGLISTTDRIPLSYWHGKLQRLANSQLMPAQRTRVERLESQLRALEEPDDMARAGTPVRPATAASH